jgi:hypothetical protein
MAEETPFSRLQNLTWPIRHKFWASLHLITNEAAWKWASPNRIADQSKILWKLNDWLASHYIAEWLRR